MTTAIADIHAVAHGMLTAAGLTDETADGLLDDIPDGGLSALADYANTHPDAATQIAGMPVDRVGFLLDIDRFPATALNFRNTLQEVTR